MVKRAFTLIEVIIVIFLILLLTSVGSYYFLHYSYTAKRLEAVTNLGHIRQLEEVFRAEDGKYVTCDWSPLQVPPPQGTSSWNDNSYFYLLGFHPRGLLRYRYAVAKKDGSLTVQECLSNVVSCYDESVVVNGFKSSRDGLIDIIAKAEGDLDNDGNISKLFIPDEPPEKVVYVNKEVF